MNQEVIINVSELEKQYGTEIVLSGISFKVHKGEIFAIFGSDGSGKTVLMEILEGLRKPTKGEAMIFNFNIKNKMEMREIKKIIGTLPQEFSTHNNLTVKENILFWGKMFDEMKNIDELMALFKITEYANIKYKRLSGSIKRKVGLAITFVNNPQLVFLDEPTANLDHYTKREIWDILLQLKKEGVTILFTTNHALETQAIADTVAILHQGLIKDIGTPYELIERYSSEKKFIIRCPNAEVVEHTINTLGNIPFTKQRLGDIVVSSDEVTLLELLEKLEKVGVKYNDIITQSPSLYNVFVTLTGQEISSNDVEESNFE